MKFSAFGRKATVRTAMLAGAAAVAIPGVAAAQDTTGDDDQAVQADTDVDQDAEPQGNVIIVTATKREQTLQETPVAVSVTGADTIERAQIRDVADLATVVPSLRVSTSQNQFATTYSVRGFGTSGANFGLEPSVAMFVDGVYRSRSVSQISDLPDIQRVEVLRGPQSTLFGKNASAGVISIVTKEPSFDFNGMVEATYGNYDAMVFKGYVTGPVTDTIAASIAGGYNRRDGYVDNAFTGNDINDRNRWFARGQVLFEPGSDLSIRLIGDYDEIDEACCAVFNLRPSATTLAIQALGGQVNDFNGVPEDDIIFSDIDPSNKITNYGGSAQIDYDFGGIGLTSITAYREMELDANQDVDFTSLELARGASIGQAKVESFTQELRFASDFDGPFNFLVGGYYFNEKVQESDQIVFGEDMRNYVNILVQQQTGGTQSIPQLEATIGALTGQNLTGQFFAEGQGLFNAMEQDNEAYSFFGNVDFDVTDRLTLTLGANYTKDKKEVVTDTISTDVFAGVNLTAVGQTAIFQQGLATQVGTLLGLGRAATAAEIGAFAGANPAGFSQVQAGVQAFAAANAANPAVNPLLALRSIQFLPPFQNCPNAVEDCSTNDDDWSWTARIAYEVTPTLNVYASWATGYKAPSFNLSRDSRPTAIDRTALISQGLAVTNLTAGSRFAAAEDSEVYELGIKGAWDYAAANLTVFKQSIENFQTNTFTGTGYLFANADKQSTFGIEFDGYVQPTEALTFNLAMTYLDPKYDSFVNSPFGDLSGTDIVNIPQLSAVFGAQWDQELGNGDNLILRGDFSYQSPVQVETGLLEYITTNPDGSFNYDTAFAAARPYRREVNNLNASLTYAMDMGLELSVWGRNLLDDRNVTGLFDSVAQSGSISAYTNQPRTYGATARFKF
ncbi:MAG: TonB-dependent receptor [Citromicrobium sp.]|nr:MAG: TonB-dependent receptor [Citromicrobium sp.]